MKYDVTPIGPTSSIRMITNLPTVDGAIFSFHPAEQGASSFLREKVLMQIDALRNLCTLNDWVLGQ